MGQVTDPGILQQLNSQPAPQPAPTNIPQVNRPPGIIRGTPRAPEQPTPLQEANLDLSQRGQANSESNEAFDRRGNLRSEFVGSDAYTNYDTAVRQLAQGLVTAENPSGDQSLIVAYARMLDPASVVREAEFDITARADSAMGRTVARLQRELGLEGGGMLSETARQRVRSEMRNLAIGYRQSYEQQRNDYSDFARRNNIDPFEVVGTDIGAPFNAQFREYDRARGIGGSAGQQADSAAGGGGGGGGNTVTLQDMYPQGAQLGMDMPEAAVSGADVLQELGITPEQERQMVGAFNAAARSRRNNFTAQDARAIFEAAGLPVPADAELAAAVEQVRSGGTFGGYDTRALEEERRRQLEAMNEGRTFSNEDLAGQGAMAGLSDEVAGLDAAATAAFNLDNPFTAYQDRRDATRLGLEQARERGGTGGVLAEIGGALLSGGVRAAPAAMRAATPVAAAAREGAILGGVAGFGYGEGPSDSLSGAAVGAATGAALGGGVSATARKIEPAARRVVDSFRGSAARPNAGEVNAVVQAGERMDVPVRRADVDPNVRDTRAQVLQSPAGQAVRAVESDDLAAMEQALAQRTGSEGVTPDRLALGDSVQNGTRRVIDRARARASAIYKRAFRASEGVEIAPTNMIAAIDENIAELTRNGATQNAASINFLRGVRNDAMNGGERATGILDSAGKPIMRGPRGLSIEALRSQRTNLRGNINQAGLSMTDMERRMSNVLSAASSDIEAGLANNADALALFREADGLWREQADFANSIGRRILGTDRQPVTPEAAAQRIAAFVRGDFNRARTLFAELPASTRADIAAQVAAHLGRNAKGEFSLSQFLTHTSTGRGGLLDERTTRLIFGERGVQAIQDLRTLAGAKIAATERTNYSNTGGVVNRMGRGLRTMMMGALGLSEGGVTGGALTIAASKLMERLGEGRAVRLLTNPDFTRWLRRLPETDNPRAINGAFRRLRNVASANAQFSSDVEAFQQALLSSANDNAVGASRIAAEEQSPQQQ